MFSTQQNRNQLLSFADIFKKNLSLSEYKKILINFRPTISTENLQKADHTFPNHIREQTLYMVLEVLQYGRWGHQKNGWESSVLNNLVKRFGENTFLNVCKAMTIIQAGRFKTSDSGITSSQPKNTLYYDVWVYSKEYTHVTTKIIFECGNQNMHVFEDMHFLHNKRIVSDHGMGNGLPFFTDKTFLQCLKINNYDIYCEYKNFLEQSQLLNFIISKTIGEHTDCFSEIFQTENGSQTSFRSNQYILQNNWHEILFKYFKKPEFLFPFFDVLQTIQTEENIQLEGRKKSEENEKSPLLKHGLTKNINQKPENISDIYNNLLTAINKTLRTLQYCEGASVLSIKLEYGEMILQFDDLGSADSMKLYIMNTMYRRERDQKANIRVEIENRQLIFSNFREIEWFIKHIHCNSERIFTAFPDFNKQKPENSDPCCTIL